MLDLGRGLPSKTGAHPDAVEDDVSRARDVVVHVGAMQAMGMTLILVKHAALAV